jgi:hypothetical protein
VGRYSSSEQRSPSIGIEGDVFFLGTGELGQIRSILEGYSFEEVDALSGKGSIFLVIKLVTVLTFLIRRVVSSKG